MRIAVLGLALALGSALPAAAQEEGVISGRVTNQSTSSPAAGAAITLSGADEDGSGRIRRRTTTDEDGRYRFEDLPSDADWLYVLDARFDGGLFPGRPFSFPRGEEPSLQTTVKVWDTTSDPNSVLITRDAMFVLPGDDGVGIIESVTVLNQTHLAYVGRGEKSTFGFGLPTGATDVGIQDASFDVPQLVETDFGFGITVALPPGESTFTYSYRVPEEGSTHVLSKTALYPTADLLVFVRSPLELDSDRLRESGTVTVEGQRYRRWVAPGFVDAGDTVLIQAVAQATMPWIPFVAGTSALVALIGAAYLFTRRRTFSSDISEDRNDLIASIASLDLEYESGSVDKDEWEAERARLKARLMELEGV